jgi:hypothetical protein
MSVCVLTFFSLPPAVFAEKALYEYDDFGHVKKASYDDGYTLSRISYIYDNIGNISNESITTQNNPNPQTSPATNPVPAG